MLDRRGIKMWPSPRMGLGRLFMRHVCSNLGGSRCRKRYMLRFERVLARVLGGGLLCGGLLLYVLPL